MKTIKCGTVPGRLAEYAAEDGWTVGDVLGLAEIQLDGRSVMLNGSATTMDVIPNDGDTIAVTQKIKGNRALSLAG